MAEDAPTKEPQVVAEDADMQKALEESLRSMYDVPRGPLPPVVIRKPESGKHQPLLEVSGKGKAKVTEEQVAHDLLSLQNPKKKSPADQYIFQRRTSTPTGSSGHDESLYAELGQSNSGVESKKEGPDSDAQDEGQAGLNPDEQSKDREHMDLDVADISPQPSTEQMDEGFIATAYPKVQKNLKLTVEEYMLLEEPASSSGTLSSLQHMSKDISFGDLFFSDKPSEADNDKPNAETEVESMVSITIQQDMSSIPLMTSLIIDLTSRPESPKVHQQFKATTIETTTTTTTTLPPPPYQQQSTAEAMMMKRIGKLEHIMANLIQENKGLEERLDKHGERLYTPEQLDILHQSFSLSKISSSSSSYLLLGFHMIIVVMEMITLTCGIKSQAGSESRPPMLNKENYVSWSYRLLRYAKSRPNEKQIHNSILNGPYVRRMIAEPGDAERDVNVTETFHEQTDDELPERVTGSNSLSLF
nr:hypothetical protein [Tanacetum cinerariifolium]